MGRSRNAVSVWARSANHQTDAQAQRNRSLGNDAENKWLEAVFVLVVAKVIGCVQITTTVEQGHRVI
jgi:hypothetical protein